jgi:uncharacterized RDD family membrane protein YckC
VPPGAAVAVPRRTAGLAAADIVVADLDRRFYAFAVDRLIAWTVDVAMAVVVARLLWSRGHVFVGVLVLVATVLAVGLVFAVLLGSTGATPGKALLGLRLVHTGSGAPVGVGPAILRTTVLGLATVPFGFGLVACAWTAVTDTSRLRRGWHDHLVSSVLLDVRRVAAVEEPADIGAPPVVNLTALRLAPSPPAVPPDRSRPPARARSRPPHAGPSTAGWVLVFDSGERVVVDTLVVVGRRPELRPGEQGARLVALPSADTSLMNTHAQVVVAGDGALVITDRGSTHGSTLVRRGAQRPLSAARPTTLLEGDVVLLGDRAVRIERERGRSGVS